jgi:chromosomal replication initiator protein
VTVDQANLVSLIPLERSASVRRHLPAVDEKGWMLPNFVVGPENELLRFLFDESQIRRLKELSPVVLYGEKSLGKTALSITLAVRWARLTRLRPLSFATGVSFAADYAAAVEIDDIDSFRRRYRECQLLLIDDLDPLMEKPAAQLELVHTLDVMAEAAKPVIFTANRLPASLAGIVASLASRLSGGLSIALQRPGLQSRSAIISTLVAQCDSLLDAEELIEFCMRYASKPLRASDLQSIVLLAMQNKTASGSIDYAVVSLLANQLFTGSGPSLLNIAKIVSRKLRIRLSEMRGATRLASVVRARSLAIYLARKLTPCSLLQIGEFFGGRDHSTVIHACRKTEKLIESDPELAAIAIDIQSELLS